MLPVSGAAPPITFDFALNTTNWDWTTSGHTLWFTQTNVAHDGVAAAQSGWVSSFQSSSLQTTLEGPGTLTYWWSVDTEYHTGGLSFSRDGRTLALSFSSRPWEWHQQTNYLGAGTHTVAWTLSNGGTVWLDEVSYTPGTTAPIFRVQPHGQSQVLGQPIGLAADAVGTPPLMFQWFFNGTNLPGENTPILVFTMEPSRVGTYFVVVTNMAGMITSSNATLSLGSIHALGTIVPETLTNAVALAASWHSLALKPDRTLTAWGTNDYGQANVPEGLTNAIAIAAGNQHSLAIRADGTVTAWGRNTHGQTDVPAGLSNVVAIAGGGSHSLALKANGTIVGWGDNTYGQLNVPEGLTNAVAVAAGGNFSLALSSDGMVQAWGHDSYGQTNVPAGLTNVIAVAAGDSHCLALKANSTVAAWGDNTSSQTNIPAGLSNAVAIAAGAFHNLALRADGTLTSWGNNSAGQCATLANVVTVAAGYYYTLALVGNEPPVVQGTTREAGWTSQRFSLSVPTQNNRVYSLEYKQSLAESNWTALPLVAGHGGTQKLVDTTATGSQRFYRVRRW